MNTLRTIKGELPPIDFQPTIAGLDVIEVPAEQSSVWMLEFKETEKAHCLARKASCYAAMDDMAEFGARAEWADTVPMAEGVAA